MRRNHMFLSVVKNFFSVYQTQKTYNFEERQERQNSVNTETEKVEEIQSPATGFIRLYDRLGLPTMKSFNKGHRLPTVFIVENTL